jgi:hypothetical protein
MIEKIDQGHRTIKILLVLLFTIDWELMCRSKERDTNTLLCKLIVDVQVKRESQAYLIMQRALGQKDLC